MGWIALRAIAAATFAVSLAVAGPVTGQSLSAFVARGEAAYSSGNYTVALEQFRIAATQGNKNAQFYLGTMYARGQGVPKNDAEAAKWYRLAAERGDETSAYVLGVMYAVGRGVPKNFAEAVRWFRLAAAQDNVEAQFALGDLYEKGDGVLQDYAQAYKWYNLATAQGHATARTSRERLQKLMTPQQIAEGQRLSAEAVR